MKEKDLSKETSLSWKVVATQQYKTVSYTVKIGKNLHSSYLFFFHSVLFFWNIFVISISTSLVNMHRNLMTCDVLPNVLPYVTYLVSNSNFKNCIKTQKLAEVHRNQWKIFSFLNNDVIWIKDFTPAEMLHW